MPHGPDPAGIHLLRASKLMSPQSVRGPVVSSELQRLDECAREPIRTPGSVQAHGVLLGLDSAFTVIVASENCADAFGMSPAEIIGRDASFVLDAATLAAIGDIADGVPLAANPVPTTLGGSRWDTLVHRSGELVVLEFEPWVQGAPAPSASVVFDAIHRLANATSVAELREQTVREVRRLTGFDRVMMYHFYADGHGEVVAEDRADDMEPYAGLHFPASDIPAQARELYLTKLSRPIVSTERPSAGLLAADGAAVGDAIDLSLAELRSVSPYHLQFMRNMGQASTVSFSLIRQGELMGMITCAHRTEHRLPFLLRSGLEVLSNQVALQLRSMDEIERLRDAAKIRELRTQLVRQFVMGEELIDGLLDGEVRLRDVIPADGVMCRIAGVRRARGFTPTFEQFEQGMETVKGSREQTFLSTDSVTLDYPELVEYLPEVAGLLFVPLGNTDYIAFLREEVIRTVNWLGDLSQQNRPDTLSPRLSFSSWSQSVSGTAVPWGASIAEAVELGNDLDRALLRRAESRLAAAALRDPLTGLPNRRALQDRLTRQLGETPASSVSLLFIDIDHFKAINDSRGHDAGDDLLIAIAQRLTSVAREQDTVARLGGDEFVVVCQNTSLDQAERVAERVLDAMRLPVEIGESPVAVTASIGIAIAEPGSSAADVLKLADLSMYRAKAEGRDRVSR